MLDDIDRIDDSVCAVLAVHGRGWVIVLHIVTGFMAIEDTFS
ncbi:MAG: hypothetical protein WAM69_13090 [Candidatus Sulfotelmatobacter sp.]